MLSLRDGFVVVGCVFVGFATSAGPGLVARAAEPDRWIESITAPSNAASPVESGEAQRRIAQLEQQLHQLEAERRAASPGRPARGRVSADVDAVSAQNRELTARNRALVAENRMLARNHLFDPPVSASCDPPPSDADPKAQLRYWAERLRDGDGAFRSRLTPDQNAALNVLLRRDRALDPHNPWRDL